MTINIVWFAYAGTMRNSSAIISTMMMVNRIVVKIAGISPTVTPSGIIMPTPSPVVPAIVTVTVIRSIPSIPGVIPWIIPSIAIIPIPGVNKMNTMVTT